MLRYCGHANVIVDAGLQSIHRVLAGGRHNHVFENGDALASCNHCDLVTCNSCGGKWRPAETDGCVSHALKGEVGQLWDFWKGVEGISDKE